MSTDEQRVRTMCGWVGVEISKSRKRKAGDPEFGLYRVRGSMPVVWSIGPGDAEIDRSPGQSQPTMWTPYAFTLAGIFLAVQNSIHGGTPAGPLSLMVEVANWTPGDGLPYRTVLTRWTSNYTGRRDLGVGCTHEPIGHCLRGLSLGEHFHGLEHCHQGGRPHLGPCTDPPFVDEGLRDATTTDACEGLLRRVVDAMSESDHSDWFAAWSTATRSDDPTPRQRQRAHNAQFHAEHLVRRMYGLRARYAAKMRRDRRPND